ncbi:hypothetical protein EDD70_1042 [Hydrogenoanaerobacterium saccharovorans]|uniref:Uncharacterized protein n=1 Tax=Hydrogenoanaerobacterium saccharovorans TaxID=474960 RepID=A0A1H8A4L2_9FIRM|nr:hypothetical protein [Hydrogenoanaerobacterium saccharovorans]RPF48227.1 hypothetical protein EDD70_1042 [Hydrogenoanaerobacterium saccharovorans]SEM64477.1 hypothetical protein SAMN05216180_1049 [Hydrogenoanaerobacterium saccharovorans]
MPREKELYRPNLEFLLELFPNKVFLTVADVEKMGISRKCIMADKTFPKKKCGKFYQIPITGLASWMS